MAETAAPAPAAAPSAPAAAPAAQPQTGRGRVSSFEQAMEAKNAAARARHDAPPTAPALENRTQQTGRQQQQPSRAVEQPTSLEETDDGLLGGPEPVEHPDIESIEDLPELLEQDQPTQAPEDAAKLEAALQEWRETGQLPELFENATLSWTDANGIERSETVKDLKENGMRLGEFHRNLNVMRQRESEMAERDNNVRGFFERVREPQVFIDEFEERGYGDTFQKAVDIELQRRKQRKAIINAAGLAVMQQYQCPGNDARVVYAMQQLEAELTAADKIKIDNRRMKRESELAQRREQAMQAQQQAQVNIATLAKSFEQLVPMALRATGLFDSEVNRAKVLEHLGAYVRNSVPNWDGTYRREYVLAAARIRRQELEHERAQRQTKPKPKPRPQSRALPPSASTGASRSGSAQPAGPGRKRPSEMESDPRFQR